MNAIEQRIFETFNVGGKPRPKPSETDLQWHVNPVDAPFRLAGFAWYAQDKIFRRMPKEPRHKLTDLVNMLANHTAGGQIQFRTDSTRLALKVTLLGPHAMDHMTAVGECGFDCYISEGGPSRYYSSTRFDRSKSEYECWMFLNLPKKMRTLTLYFPLYQGVKEVSVGLDSGSQIEAPPPYVVKNPVVVYGTSITQGGCANRTGMAYTNILARRLNAEIINLGFSGSGCGEPEVARTINEIANPSMLVIDNDGNMRDLALINERMPAFLSILREVHKTTPILVISRPRFSTETIFPDMIAYRNLRRDAYRKIVEDRRAQGDRNVEFFDGANLYGDDVWEECTVDGVHSTDLGYIFMAKALEPVFRKLLKLEK
ncbi:MAG TPA: SGNH/GDSL hydrolase family protein [Planctomycetota bacterium]|nr:SGNH/GDSL hydrolase family protein [Planctomycetota bacterium]